MKNVMIQVEREIEILIESTELKRIELSKHKPGTAKAVELYHDLVTLESLLARAVVKQIRKAA